MYRIEQNVCKARLADDRPAKVTDRQRDKKTGEICTEFGRMFARPNMLPGLWFLFHFKCFFFD
jgi:hypothetical protein